MTRSSKAIEINRSVFVISAIALCFVVVFVQGLTHLMQVLVQMIIPVLIMAGWAGLAVGVGMGAFWLLKRYQEYKEQQQAQLQTTFYHLLQENNGRITVLDLSLKANLKPKVAQQYLEEQATDFAADFAVSDQGEMWYQFPIAKALESQPSWSGSAIAQTTLETQPLNRFQPLIQAELARRLNVSPSTIRNHKFKPDFSEWSQSKDPQGIAWVFSPENQQFYPLD